MRSGGPNTFDVRLVLNTKKYVICAINMLVVDDSTLRNGNSDFVRKGDGLVV